MERPAPSPTAPPAQSQCRGSHVLLVRAAEVTLMHTNEIVSAAHKRVASLVAAGSFKANERWIKVDPEDRSQEATCLVLEMAVRYAKGRGVLLDPAILVHAHRQRAVDRSRHFVSGSHSSNDVLDPRCFQSGHASVLSLEGIHQDGDEHDGEGDRQLLGLAAEMAANPTRSINSALDLENWLDGLDTRDRRILSMRVAGFSLEEIGAVSKLTPIRVCVRIKELGRALCEQMGLKAPRSNRGRKSKSVEH